MNALVFVAALVISGIAQTMNRYPVIPTGVVKLTLALVGLCFYLLIQHPTAWTGQPLLDWLDTAWIWAAALPGIASLIGTAPGMQTNSAGTKPAATNGG